jgi:hypothetical protein
MEPSMKVVILRMMFAGSLLVAAAATNGCSRPAPATPVRVRANGITPEAGQALKEGRPVIIELQQGDIVPLRFTLDGDDLATPSDAPLIPLIAKRHFFLRISPEGITSSTDGVTFDAKPRTPGSFRIGLHLTKEGTGAEIEIHTPKR